MRNLQRIKPARPGVNARMQAAVWLLREYKSIKLKSLNGQKFISFEPDTPTRKAQDKILKQHGVEVNHAMEFDNVETVKRAVEIDAGISIVPQGSVIQEIGKGTLAAVAISDGEFYLFGLPRQGELEWLMEAAKEITAIYEQSDQKK